MESLSGKIRSVSLFTLIIVALLGFSVFTQNAGAQPSNDECAGAIPVFDGVNAYDNIGSSTSAPPWPCALGGSDVWFVYTATCTGTVVFETCNDGALPFTDYDSAIQIFGAGTCAEIGIFVSQCNDDFCGLQSSIARQVESGETILLRVGGFGGSQGTGHLSIIPQGDCIAGASDVPTLSEWGLLAMAGVLGMIGFIAMRRRRAAA